MSALQGSSYTLRTGTHFQQLTVEVLCLLWEALPFLLCLEVRFCMFFFSSMLSDPRFESSPGRKPFDFLRLGVFFIFFLFPSSLPLAPTPKYLPSLFIERLT